MLSTAGLSVLRRPFLACLVACLACLGSAISAASQSSDGDETYPPSRGFNHCTTPLRPVCVSRLSVYLDPEAKSACQRQTNRYVDQVFAYRACLEREIRRAVREANETSDEIRCRSQGGRQCSGAGSASRGQ
jgi:hypothetical protein